MKRLGEVLIAKGVLSPDGLRSGLDACRRHGGRLGTWLVRLGLVNEGTLLEALAEQTGCPPATALELATAPSELRGLIAPAYAKRHMVVAFNRQGRNLDVALANPNDLVLVDEIGSVTGMVVRPHVATEAALAAALALPVVTHGEAGSAPAPGPPPGTLREWRQFWRLDSTPQELFRALETTDLAPPPYAAAAFPSLGPLIGAHAAEGEQGLADLAESLTVTQHRDQAARVVLDYCTSLAPRVALFSIYQGKKVMGWEARGQGVVQEDFQTLILPLDRPSVFLNMIKGVEMHIGALGSGEGNALLIEALGDPPPKEALIAPVRVRGKVAAFLWLDNVDQSVGEIPASVVQEVTRLTGLTLEILVLRQKIRTAARLTEHVAAE